MRRKRVRKWKWKKNRDKKRKEEGDKERKITLTSSLLREQEMGRKKWLGEEHLGRGIGTFLQKYQLKLTIELQSNQLVTGKCILSSLKLLIYYNF
jgi:hypothetical protein